MWSTEAYYEVLGTRFYVRADEPAVGHELDRVLAGFRRGPTGVRGQHRYSLASTLGETHSLYRDCAVADGSRSRSALVSSAIASINRDAIDGFTGYAVHAGVVAMGGRAIAFPAESGDGKSTLTAACLGAGFAYVSDEALCVDYETAEVVPYPKPLALSHHSLALLGVEAAAGELQRTPDDEVVLLPAELGADVAATPLRLAHLVVIDRTGGDPQMEPLSKIEGMERLLRLSFNHYKNPEQAFRLASALTEGCTTWRLVLGDPVAAAGLLRERLG